MNIQNLIEFYFSMMQLLENLCSIASSQLPNSEMKFLQPVHTRFPCATPGSYKTLPNHVLLPDGHIHHYVEPIHVAAEMDRLCRWIAEAYGKLHPVVSAATAHYNFVRIHSFDDGNGRGARLLMNLILMQAALPPIIVANERRRTYLDTLRQADAGDLAPFPDLHRPRR